jgi:elongation factor P
MSFVRRETALTRIMASIQATRLRKGMLVKFGNDLFRVLDLQHVTPGNLRGFVRARFRNIRNGSLSDQKLRSEDSVERAVLDEREMQFMYKDGDSYHFMDTDTYDQLHIDSEVLGDAANYLVPEATIKVEFYGSEPVGIELPLTVDLKVTETVPGIKGATASAQVKPATLETGLVVQVPPFIDIDDVVRVNTETGEYLKKL